MTAVNRADFLTFPPGVVRMEKPRPGDVRKMPDGSYDVTCRLTRLVMTTPEERAAALIEEHPLEYAVGNKHHSPRKCLEVIAAAIAAAEREAVERERELRRCVRCRSSSLLDLDFHCSTCYREMEQAAARIREEKS